MTHEKIGIYKLSDNKAKSYGYSEIYAIGPYEINEKEKIIKIAEIVDVYDPSRLKEVDPADFKNLGGQKLEEGKKLFKKYGIEVDVILSVPAENSDEKYLYGIYGAKL